MFVALASVSASEPRPRLIVPPVSALPRVTTSAPVPPVSVSTLEIVAVVPAPRTSVSAPPPRSMVAALTAPERTTTSSAVPAATVSTPVRVDGAARGVDRQPVGPGAQIDGPGVGGGQRDEVGGGAADDGLDVAQRDGVGEGASVSRSLPAPRSSAPAKPLPSVTTSLVVPPASVSTLVTVSVLSALASVSESSARAQVDHAPGHRRAQRDEVVGGPAGQRLDVGHGQRVDLVGQRQRVDPAGEVDDRPGGLRAQVTASAPVPPVTVSTLETVAVVPAPSRQPVGRRRPGRWSRR